MAHLTISNAKSVCSTHNLQAAVIIGIERNGDVRIVTYGETLPKCRSIGEWAMGLWDHAITAVPFRTMFGMGRSGVATKLTPEELAVAHCSPEYIERNTARNAV